MKNVSICKNSELLVKGSFDIFTRSPEKKGQGFSLSNNLTYPGENLTIFEMEERKIQSLNYLFLVEKK